MKRSAAQFFKVKQTIILTIPTCIKKYQNIEVPLRCGLRIWCCHCTLQWLKSLRTPVAKKKKKKKEKRRGMCVNIARKLKRANIFFLGVPAMEEWVKDPVLGRLQLQLSVNP